MGNSGNSGNSSNCCGTQNDQTDSDDFFLFKNKAKQNLNYFKQQRWYVIVEQAIEQSDKSHLYTQLVNEMKMTHVDKRIDKICQHLSMKENILQHIYNHYVNRNFNEPSRSQMIKSNTSSLSVPVNNSIKFQSLAQSFIKISESALDLLQIVDDITQFINYFSTVIVEFYKFGEKDNLEMAIGELLMEMMFNFSTFYGMVKQNFDRQLIGSYKKYKEHLKKLQNAKFEVFEIKDLDYSESIRMVKQISEMRSPLSKLNSINQAVKALHEQMGNYDADHLINVLVYIIIKADVPYFVSEIKMIEHFSQQFNKMGEQAYVLISFMAALEYIILLE